MNDRSSEHDTGRMTGPVIERRGQVREGSTTDQRLLDSRGPTDWVHTDPWRVLRIQAEFVEGFGALAELGPAIAVFGSARTPTDHLHYAMAEEVGRRLAEAHGAGAMVQINRHIAAGAATYDPPTATFVLDHDALVQSIGELVRDLVMIQHRGDRAEADAFIEKNIRMSLPMQAAFKKMATIPVDIRPVYPLAGESEPR